MALTVKARSERRSLCARKSSRHDRSHRIVMAKPQASREDAAQCMEATLAPDRTPAALACQPTIHPQERRLQRASTKAKGRPIEADRPVGMNPRPPCGNVAEPSRLWLGPVQRQEAAAIEGGSEAASIRLPSMDQRQEANA